MASTISGSVTQQVQVSDSISPGTGLSNYTIPITPSQTTNYTNGSGASQVSKAYQATFALAVSTPQTVDLSAVVCTDGTTGFATVREVQVFNDATATAKDLTLDAPTNYFAYWLASAVVETVPSGSSVRHACPNNTAGWTVDGTHKLITLNPGTNTFQARIVVLGS